MDFKKTLSNLFSYTPPKTYDFELPKNDNSQTNSSYQDSDSNKKNNKLSNNIVNNSDTDNVNIFPSLRINLEYMKTKYNLLINSDIVLREFTLNARGKQYNAFLVYIDGMVNSQIMDDFILKPLMLRNKNNLYDGSQNKVVAEAVSNNITVRKIKKFDLASYLNDCLMPQNSVKKITSFDKAANGINSR